MGAVWWDLKGIKNHVAAGMVVTARDVQHRWQALWHVGLLGAWFSQWLPAPCSERLSFLWHASGVQDQMRWAVASGVFVDYGVFRHNMCSTYGCDLWHARGSRWDMGEQAVRVAG